MFPDAEYNRIGLTKAVLYHEFGSSLVLLYWYMGREHYE
jgi:hypothetical protein